MYPAEQYIEDVLGGRIPACKLVRLAVERHVADLQSGPRRGLQFDPAAGQHVVDYFRRFLRHSKGEWAGQPFIPAPWQCFNLWNLFGWKRADGLRRFRIGYICVPRKNGKSTFVAGVGLYLFQADGEPGAEVYTAATKRDQAKIIWDEAARMVRKSPDLNRRIKIVAGNMNLPGTASKFEPLGADADTLDGLNAHGTIIDELHKHKTREVWDVMETATGARRQPMQIAVTTAGFGRMGICWEQHDYAVKVLEGSVEDDTYFAFISTIDPEDMEHWDTPAAWAKANPNYGVSVKVDDLERKAAKARQVPAAINTFLRKHLDVWTEQAEKAIDPEKWRACGSLVDAAALEGETCYGALDLSSKNDTTSLVLVFGPTDQVKLWRVLPFFWIPADNIAERVHRDRVPYDAWVRAGFLETTPGNTIDYGFIRRRINELRQHYVIREIACDPWNAADLMRQLQDDGFTVVEYHQGFAFMAGPTREVIENLVPGGRLAHGNHPVLAWQASNLSVILNADGDMRPSRKKSLEKIDGMTALIMGVGRGMANGQESSVYEDRGVRTT